MHLTQAQELVTVNTSDERCTLLGVRNRVLDTETAYFS